MDGLTVFLILIFGVFIPIIVMWGIAASMERSPAHMLWGLIGWLGVIIGLLFLIATKPESRATRQA